jgi:transcriptional regulator with XRE-family HTH domain
MESPPDRIDSDVGARMRFLRSQQGMSLAELADALGLTFQQVRDYEHGSRRISASMIVKIAAKLEVGPVHLYGAYDPRRDGASDDLRRRVRRDSMGVRRLCAGSWKSSQRTATVSQRLICRRSAQPGTPDRRGCAAHEPKHIQMEIRAPRSRASAKWPRGPRLSPQPRSDTRRGAFST